MSMCELFSHLFPESEPKCPTGSAGLARRSNKLPKWSPRVSKYEPRVITTATGVSKCSPRARKYVPNCTFFQKASQRAHRPRRPGPELQEAIKIEPTGVKIRPPGHQNGDRESLNAALGARKYVPKQHAGKSYFIAQDLGLPLLSASPYIGPTLNRRIMVPLSAGAEPNIADFLQGSAAMLRTSIYTNICISTYIYIHICLYIYIYIYIHI